MAGFSVEYVMVKKIKTTILYVFAIYFIVFWVLISIDVLYWLCN